jgi:ParB-like chromosome segregation protein Spo0J
MPNWPRAPPKYGHLLGCHVDLSEALVLIDEQDVILGGHARVQAAKELGLPTIQVRVMSGMTKDMKRAYVITDNKMALLAEWDLDLLKDEIELLIQADFTIETTGFSTAETDRCSRTPRAIRMTCRTRTSPMR